MNASLSIHLHTLFRQMQPEWLLNEILSSTYTAIAASAEQKVNSYQHLYLKALRSLPQNARRTDDELLVLYREIRNCLSQYPHGDLFTLLVQYVREALDCHGQHPLCRQEYILDWRELSLVLGQDLLTCAGLAYEDVQPPHQRRTDFSWPAAIHTDHHMLQKMLLRGISENHFHLNGSTQIFPLAWAFLMNHPEKTGVYFADPMFAQNLMPAVTYGTNDNQKSMEWRILLAAWIRQYLFTGLSGDAQAYADVIPELRAFCNCVNQKRLLKPRIEALRYRAPRFPSGKNTACLDYAITSDIMAANQGGNRLLAGERSFLYSCYRKCFEGHLSPDATKLFYLYLLIKLRFREELIQANGRLGFQNFSNYQDRKTHLWSALPEYVEESYRLAIAEVLREGQFGQPYVQSLEMRIMPRKSRRALEQYIRDIDCYAMASRCHGEQKRPVQRLIHRQDSVCKSDDPVCDQSRYYYVLHFAKKAEDDLLAHRRRGNSVHTMLRPRPRNYAVRKRVEAQAKAIFELLGSSSPVRNRIRGIDACSNEIGCRPETFATAFRFLRSQSAQLTGDAGAACWLRATYHVGEDFLDLTDGLRAIDEAICFLNLRRGDRLGHALALGTQPAQFYRIKDSVVYMPKQDLLDNLVWVLYRSLEWNIQIPSELRNSLAVRARLLLREIYGDCGSRLHLTDYYQSWKLRGNDPSEYALSLRPPQQACLLLKRHDVAYKRAQRDDRLWDCGTRSITVASLLNQETLQTNSGFDSALHIHITDEELALLRQYHFDMEVRRRGQEIIAFSVTEPYVQLIEDLQESMMEKIMHKGIAIECNPSSNKLIGTFDRYDQHPIFRFNHCHLTLPEFPSQQTQLCVSVNTDDLGVFDTSLENEYALLCGCLQNRLDEKGMRLVSDDAILTYLNHLRELGNDMAFTKTTARGG